MIFNESRGAPRVVVDGGSIVSMNDTQFVLNRNDNGTAACISISEGSTLSCN